MMQDAVMHRTRTGLCHAKAATLPQEWVCTWKASDLCGRRSRKSHTSRRYLAGYSPYASSSSCKGKKERKVYGYTAIIMGACKGSSLELCSCNGHKLGCNPPTLCSARLLFA